MTLSRDEAFCRALVGAVGAGATLKTERGSVRFEANAGRSQHYAGDDIAKLAVSMPGAQGSNTIVSLGDRLFLKGYRRVSVGLNPEVEIGRFLTDAGFEHAVPVAGSVEYVGDDGRNATLAIVQAYVSNQGDGWGYTVDYLDRFFDALPRESEGPSGVAGDVHGGYLSLARTLGIRTAELHRTFARSTGDAGVRSGAGRGERRRPVDATPARRGRSRARAARAQA